MLGSVECFKAGDTELRFNSNFLCSRISFYVLKPGIFTDSEANNSFRSGLGAKDGGAVPFCVHSSSRPLVTTLLKFDTKLNNLKKSSVYSVRRKPSEGKTNRSSLQWCSQKFVKDQNMMSRARC